MRKPVTVKALEEFGRVRLSKNFFMREFLYSEISQIELIQNIPDDPDLAIAAGKQLCEQVLEPIQEALGRISIRSAFRAQAVNKKGNENKYNCSGNEDNFAEHIWDVKDANGYMGATACIVVNSFIDYYERTSDWTALAWWIHDHIDNYRGMTFFPKYAAFNIGWSENPESKKLVIDSHVINPHTGKKGHLTKIGLDNYAGSHKKFYRDYISEIS